MNKRVIMIFDTQYNLIDENDFESCSKCAFDNDYETCQSDDTEACLYGGYWKEIK